MGVSKYETCFDVAIACCGRKGGDPESVRKSQRARFPVDKLEDIEGAEHMDAQVCWVLAQQRFNFDNVELQPSYVLLSICSVLILPNHVRGQCTRNCKKNKMR